MSSPHSSPAALPQELPILSSTPPFHNSPLFSPHAPLFLLQALAPFCSFPDFTALMGRHRHSYYELWSLTTRTGVLLSSLLPQFFFNTTARREENQPWDRNKWTERIIEEPTRMFLRLPSHLRIWKYSTEGHKLLTMYAPPSLGHIRSLELSFFSSWGGEAPNVLRGESLMLCSRDPCRAFAHHVLPRLTQLRTLKVFLSNPCRDSVYTTEIFLRYEALCSKLPPTLTDLDVTNEQIKRKEDRDSYVLTWNEALRRLVNLKRLVLDPYIMGNEDAFPSSLQHLSLDSGKFPNQRGGRYKKRQALNQRLSELKDLQTLVYKDDAYFTREFSRDTGFSIPLDAQDVFVDYTERDIKSTDALLESLVVRKYRNLTRLNVELELTPPLWKKFWGTEFAPQLGTLEVYFFFESKDIKPSEYLPIPNDVMPNLHSIEWDLAIPYLSIPRGEEEGKESESDWLVLWRHAHAWTYAKDSIRTVKILQEILEEEIRDLFTIFRNKQLETLEIEEEGKTTYKWDKRDDIVCL